MLALLRAARQPILNIKNPFDVHNLQTIPDLGVNYLTHTLLRNCCTDGRTEVKLYAPPSSWGLNIGSRAVYQSMPGADTGFSEGGG